MKILSHKLLYTLLLVGLGKGVTAVGVGDQAPEFSLVSVDDTTIHLSDYRDKVVFLHFIGFY